MYINGRFIALKLQNLLFKSNVKNLSNIINTLSSLWIGLQITVSKSHINQKIERAKCLEMEQLHPFWWLKLVCIILVSIPQYD